MINASTIPLLLAAISGAISCIFSFHNQSPIFSVLSIISLLLIIASPLINRRRELKAASAEEPANLSSNNTYNGLSVTTSLVLSLLVAACMALLLVTPVRWPAAIAFGLAMVNLSLKFPTRTPLKRLLVALTSMICVWPLAPEMTQRIETRTQIYLGRLISDRLDSRNILNYPSGRTIEIVKGKVDVTPASGHLSGLRAGVLAAFAVGMVMNRGPLHVLLLASAGYFWALFGNALTVFGGAVGMSGEGGAFDTLWASVPATLLACLILVLSSDQLILVLSLFNPFMWIKRDRKYMDNEMAQGDESPSLESDLAAQPRRIPVAVFLVPAVACLGIMGADISRTTNKLAERKAFAQKWQSFQEDAQKPLWPNQFGRWLKIKEQVLGEAPRLNYTPDSKIFSSTYGFNNKLVRASWAGPVWGWQDRFQDYMLQGWKVGNARIISESASNKPYMIVDLTLPTGERGKLVYLVQSTDGKSALDPNLRSIPRAAWFHFLQSLFFRGGSRQTEFVTELFLQSYANFRDEDMQSLDEIATGVFTKPLPDGLK
jgi:hypothetical protein